MNTLQIQVACVGIEPQFLKQKLICYNISWLQKNIQNHPTSKI
jgi:hypothetical protein